MGRHPNTMLQIRFVDDEDGSIFAKLAAEQGKVFDVSGEDDEEEDRPYFDVKLGDDSYTFQFYDGYEDPEFGIAARGDTPQTIGYIFLTYDWTDVIDVPALLVKIVHAQEWADQTADRLGTKHTLTVGANFW